jgi:MEMO1 family protein
VQPQISIVPIVLGNQDRSHCLELGEALAAVMDGTTQILIASSDLSHFHPDEKAKILDERVALAIKEFDPEKLMKQLSSGEGEACGGGPIAAVMIAAKQLGCSEATVLHQCTSGDITGDYGRVVGYLSAAFWKAY